MMVVVIRAQTATSISASGMEESDICSLTAYAAIPGGGAAPCAICGGEACAAAGTSAPHSTQNL